MALVTWYVDPDATGLGTGVVAGDNYIDAFKNFNAIKYYRWVIRNFFNKVFRNKALYREIT
jgi:hypothetical protein